MGGERWVWNSDLCISPDCKIIHKINLIPRPCGMDGNEASVNYVHFKVFGYILSQHTDIICTRNSCTLQVGVVFPNFRLWHYSLVLFYLLQHIHSWCCTELVQKKQHLVGSAPSHQIAVEYYALMSSHGWHSCNQNSQETTQYHTLTWDHSQYWTILGMHMHRVNNVACSIVCSMATLHTHLWSVATTQGYSFLGSKHLPPRIPYCLHCKDSDRKPTCTFLLEQVMLRFYTISQIEQSLIVVSNMHRHCLFDVVSFSLSKSSFFPPLPSPFVPSLSPPSHPQSSMQAGLHWPCSGKPGGRSDELCCWCLHKVSAVPPVLVHWW